MPAIPHMLVRQRPAKNALALFSGSFDRLPLRNPRHQIELEGCALWCFEFGLGPTGPAIAQYVGVFDLDFELDPQEIKTLQEGRLPMKIFTLVEKIHFTFPVAPMAVYFSGGKGVHVYVQDARLMVTPASRPMIEQYLTYLLGAETVQQIDLSIYGTRSGIRPYTCEHPKTDWKPNQVYAYYDFHWDTFFGFLDMAAVNATPMHVPTIITQNKPAEEVLHKRLPASNVDRMSTERDVYDAIVDYLKTHDPSNRDLRYEEHETYVKFVNQRWCPLKNGPHRRCKMYWVVYKYHAKMKCFSLACQQAEFILRVKIPPATQIPNMYRNSCNHLISIDKDRRYIEVDDLEAAYSQSNILFVAAPMGCGKTESFKNLLAGEGPKKTLMIVTRKCQAYNFAARFGMTNYLHGDKILYGEENAVVCLNSLPRVLAEDGTLPCYDYLILDEIESIVKLLTSVQLNSGPYRQRNIWDLFCLLIKASRRVIMMDGLPTDNLFKFFVTINVWRHMSVIEHLSQPDCRVYHQITNPYFFKHRFRKCLENNEKVVLVSTGKSDMQSFYDDVKEDYNCFMINGNSPDEVKQTSSDPDKNWSGYDVLCFNGAVGPGASYGLKDYSCMFLLIMTNLADPNDLYQLVNRIRNLKTNMVYCYFSDHNANEPPPFNQMKHRACKKIVTFHELQKQIGVCFAANQGENIRLVTYKEDPRVLQELAGNKQLSLTYESDDFLETHVRAKWYQQTYHDRERYMRIFFALVASNGGLVENRSCSQDDLKAEKCFKVAMINDSKTRGDVKGSFMIPRGERTVTQMTYIQKQVNINFVSRQQVFIKLREAMRKELNRTYEREFQQINQGRTRNNMCSYTELVAGFQDMLAFFGLQYDPHKGYILGTFNIQPLLEDKADWLKIQAAILSELRLEYKVSNYNEDYQSPQQAYQIVRNLFTDLGYKLNKGKPDRKSQNSQRKQKTWITISKDSVDIRNAIQGFNYVTLEPSNREEAITFLLQNKKID